MTTYPKKIKLHHEKLKQLLEEKGKLIKEGIKKSEYIETYENTLQEIDKKIQAFEATVDISDLGEKAKVITEEVNQAIAKMEVIKKEIYDRMKKDAPKELYVEYDNLKKLKEETESERNKLALNAQKYTDKIIPLARKLMTPYLEDEFDDYGAIKLENDEVVAQVFNHLEDFRQNFKSKANKIK